MYLDPSVSINCKYKNMNNIRLDPLSITKQITKTKERVLPQQKTPSNQEVQLLKKHSSLQEHTSTRHHKKEMVIKLIQQATNRWRAILTTEGVQICSEFFHSASYWVTLQLPKESVMSLVRTPLERTVQRSTRKPTRSYKHYKKKKSFTHNIMKEEKEAIKTLREDASCMVLTADRGVALIVMDKSQ